jgi:hypothetical protein
MTNDEGKPNDEIRIPAQTVRFGVSNFVIRASSLLFAAAPDLGKDQMQFPGFHP